MTAPHIDAHFVRGHDHLICEDYALATDCAAVVADGCSGSLHTDVGARLVAHAAAQAPHVAVSGEVGWLEPAERACVALNLDPSALDCTCGIALARAEEVAVALFGDGVVVARRHGGALEVHEVVFPSGAPAYPSYGLCPGRLDAYRAAGLSARHVHARVVTTGPLPGVSACDACDSQPMATAHRTPAAVRWTFPKQSYSAVFIATDGLAAFGCGNDPVLLEAVVPHVVRIPAPRGAFMGRRLRRLIHRDAADRDWVARDDVAIGAVCWGDAL